MPRAYFTVADDEAEKKVTDFLLKRGYEQGPDGVWRRKKDNSK